MVRENPVSSSENPEISKSNVDRFLESLTQEQREILNIYVNIEIDDLHFSYSQMLMHKYGAKFTWLAHMVQELTSEYGCTTEAMCRVISRRLSTPPSSGERVVDPDSDPEPVTLASYMGSIGSEDVILAPHELPQFQENGPVSRVQQFLSDLPEQKRAILKEYLSLPVRDDKKEIGQLAERHGTFLWQVVFEVQQLEEVLGCSHDDMKNALTICLQGGTITPEYLEPPVLLIHKKGPEAGIPTVISTRQRVEKTARSGFFGLFRKNKRNA